jgi:hypothetical protein
LTYDAIPYSHRHSGAREARTRNLEIPGSPAAPRNDSRLKACSLLADIATLSYVAVWHR